MPKFLVFYWCSYEALLGFFSLKESKGKPTHCVSYPTHQTVGTIGGCISPASWELWKAAGWLCFFLWCRKYELQNWPGWLGPLSPWSTCSLEGTEWWMDLLSQWKRGRHLFLCLDVNLLLSWKEEERVNYNCHLYKEKKKNKQTTISIQTFKWHF